MGNSGRFPRGKPAATGSRYQTDGACWVFQCFCNPPNSDMDRGIFNVHTDVNACDCTRGCTDTVRESALKVDSRRKIPCLTGMSNLCRRRAGSVLCQLSYISDPEASARGSVSLHTVPEVVSYYVQYKNKCVPINSVRVTILLHTLPEPVSYNEEYQNH